MSGNPIHRVRFLLLYTALALGGMMLFYSRYDPWKAAGPERITDGGFESAQSAAGWSGWNDLTRRDADGGFQGTAGVVLHSASNRHGTLRLTIRSLAGVHAFRVSLRATAANVIPGTKGYHVPRALFFFHDRQGKSMWHISHGITDIEEDRPWRHYSGVFPVPAEAEDARLHIQNDGTGGTMRIDDVSAVPVLPRASAPWWRLFFGGLWLTLFARWVFILRPWKKRCGALVLLTALVILTGTIMPGEQLDSGIQSFNSTLRNRMKKPPAAVQQTGSEIKQVDSSASARRTAKSNPENFRPTPAGRRLIDRVHLTGHFALYSLLAFFAALAWLGATSVASRTGAVLSGLILFAAATEVLQLITPDRKAGWQDLLINLAGVFTAILLFGGLKAVQSAFRRIRP